MLVYPNGVVVDVDLGLGREFGYDDPMRYRVYATRVWQLSRNRARCHPKKMHAAHGKCHACLRRDKKTSKLNETGEEQT